MSTRRTDPHPGRAAAAITAIWTVGGMAVSLWWNRLHGLRSWMTPGDVWETVKGAHYVAAGALAYVYEAMPRYRGTPLFAVVLAPVAYLGDVFRLTEQFPYHIPRPSLWLLLGPLLLVLAVVGLHAMRYVDAHVAPGPYLGTQLAFGALVVVPATWPYGHIEDVLAGAFLLYASAADLRGRPRWVGLAMSVAVAFKHWTVLILPVLVVRAPRGERLRLVLFAAALPAALVALPLLLDPGHAVPALLRAETFPTVNDAAPWVPSTERWATTPLRVGMVVAALVVAARLRGTRDASLLFAGVTAIGLARLLLEPVPFSYYTSALIIGAILHERATGGRIFRSSAAGIVLVAWFAVEAPRPWWWITMAALAVAVATPAVRTIVARPSTAPGHGA